MFFLAHAALFSLRKIESRFTALCRIFLFFGAVYLLWAGMAVRRWNAESVVAVANGLFVYVMLFMGYLEFYFTADRSMTVRILREIQKGGDEGLTVDEVSKVYDVNRYYVRRFEEMSVAGYLEFKDGKYANTPKGARVAKLYDFVIRFLRLEGG